MKRTNLPVIVLLGIILGFLSISATGQDQPPGQVLIKNVRIFDGKVAKLSAATDVLVFGNTIADISDGAADSAHASATVIDGGGRVLMPGLIESHAHLTWSAVPLNDLAHYLPSYEQVVAAAQARNMLMRGVTSVRDLGGPVFGLKRAIDEDVVPGPRI